MSSSFDRPVPGSTRARIAGCAALAVAWALLGAAPASGQSGIERAYDGCSAGQDGAVAALCGDAALGLQAIQGGLGLLMSAGGPLTASPSTAGNRTPGSPRIVVEAGSAWTSFSHPGLAGGTPAPDRRTSVFGGRLGATVGVFDGVRLAPSVAGVFAIDVVGMIQWLRVPASPLSTGSRVGWGGGVRVGVFRESFSLPGITLSAMHHRVGSFTYGAEPGASATLDPTLTSFRVIVGKDLWPIGVSGGVGWDRYRGEGSLEASSSAGSGATTGGHSLRMNRKYAFAGVNYTWLITQIALEASWASEGSGIVAFEGTGPFEPGGRELQASLAFRVIY